MKIINRKIFTVAFAIAALVVGMIGCERIRASCQTYHSDRGVSVEKSAIGVVLPQTGDLGPGEFGPGAFGDAKQLQHGSCRNQPNLNCSEMQASSSSLRTI